MKVDVISKGFETTENGGKMKNRSVYTFFVLMIIASLAACAAPSTPIPTPTLSPLPTTVQPPTVIPPTTVPTTTSTIPVPPGTLAFEGVNSAAGVDGNQADIYLINTDGTGLKQITEQLPADTNWREHPAWSPDGTRIAYHSGPTADMSGDFFLWVANADGSRKVQITKQPLKSYWPSWSHDGKYIAFTSKQCQIYVVKPDGSEPKKVTSGPNDLFPEWTPDGSILFVRRVGNCEGSTGDVFSVQPDGSGLKQLTKLGHVLGFSLSPDGKTVAYYDGKNYKIMVYPLDGSKPPTPIFAPLFRATFIQPAWSPDGKTIAIASNSWGLINGSKLYLVNTDGSGFTEVPLKMGVLDPVWKPE
jgi:Tol biopolymer transport system component